MSSSVTQTNYLPDEKDEFIRQQERIFIAMEKSNQLREQELEQRKKELQASIEHDCVTRERILTDNRQIEVDKQHTLELEEENKLEHKKLQLIEQQVADLQIIIELLRNYLSTTVPNNESKLTNFHQKLDWILELLRIILSRMLPDAEKAEKDRLAELLKYLAQSGNTITVHPDTTVNAGQIDTLNNQEGHGTINAYKR